MSKRSSQSSQVGLFSEQISEQIGRLRVLAGGETERAGVVATKRAVMATRLLAGSARILHVEILPEFLNELLAWLQRIEATGRPSTPTQSMILEAIITFEEGLMRHLEKHSGDDLDLAGFEDEIQELRGLIRENSKRQASGTEPPMPRAHDLDPEPKPAPVEIPEFDDAPPFVPSPKPQPAPPEEELIQPEPFVAEEETPPPAPAVEAEETPQQAPVFEVDEAPQPEPVVEAEEAPQPERVVEAEEAPQPEPVVEAEETPSIAEVPAEESVAKALETIADFLGALDMENADRLRGDHEFVRQLQRLQGATEDVLHSAPSPEVTPDAPVEQEQALEHTAPIQPVGEVDSLLPRSEDPLARALEETLHVLVQRFPGRLDAKVDGVGGELVPGLSERAEKILQQLLEDAFEILLQMFHEDDAPEVARLEVKLERRDRRLRLSVRDNGPSLGDSPALEHADPLGLYRGLRRARGTIEELRGLINVEPGDRPGTRFVLSLPLDATRPLVRMIDLMRTKAALPGLLTEEYLSTDGLLFHRDTDGEHFMLHGQPVPLVDLSNYVPGLDPLAEDAPGIAIVGSVEKRVGIYCYGLGPGEETPHFDEAVDGWQIVSGKAVEVEGRHIPLLSVARLLELRMQMPEMDEAGSVQDPMLDAYVPSDDEVTVAILPAELPEQPVSQPVPVPTELPSGKMSWEALLVNQSEFRRRELARILEERGYQVTVVEDLGAGLDYLEQHLVHLVVTDLRLGDKGAKGLTEFRTAHPELPVVLTSSVAREYAEELARRTGVSACWLEPYHATDLDRILSGRA